MNHQYKSLTLGILVGTIVSVVIFAGGIYAWKQLSTVDLKVPADQETSIVFENKHFKFTYHPELQLLSVFYEDNQGHNEPVSMGYGASWPGGRYTLTQITPDYIILHFAPSQFTTMEDVTIR